MAFNREKVVSLALTGLMEYEVTQQLLAGNDTQCFTTEQFGEARDRWVAIKMGVTREMLGMEKPSVEVDRKQLEVCPFLVEVGPNVWTLKELTNPLGER